MKKSLLCMWIVVIAACGVEQAPEAVSKGQDLICLNCGNGGSGWDLDTAQTYTRDYAVSQGYTNVDSGDLQCELNSTGEFFIHCRLELFGGTGNVLIDCYHDGDGSYPPHCTVQILGG